MWAPGKSALLSKGRRAAWLPRSLHARARRPRAAGPPPSKPWPSPKRRAVLARCSCMARWRPSPCSMPLTHPYPLLHAFNPPPTSPIPLPPHPDHELLSGGGRLLDAAARPAGAQLQARGQGPHRAVERRTPSHGRRHGARVQVGSSHWGNARGATARIQLWRTPPGQGGRVRSPPNPPASTRWFLCAVFLAALSKAPSLSLPPSHRRPCPAPPLCRRPPLQV